MFDRRGHSAFWFAEVDFGVVEVVFGIFEDEGAVLVREFAAEFGGNAGPESARGNDGVLGDDCAGGDDGTGADAAVVQDAGADADEALVFHDAAVDRGIVADGDPVADDDRVEVTLAVEDGAVLDVGVGADADGVDVAAEDSIHPHGGLLAQGDVADELGGEIDITTGVDLGYAALETANHRWKPPRRLFHFEAGLGGE